MKPYLDTMKILNSDLLFYLIFFVITISILWKLLLPGYVLTLDMVWSEQAKNDLLKAFYGFYDFSNGMILIVPTAQLLYSIVVYALNLLLPMWIIQKILLFLVFFVSGISAYKLCPTESKLGRLFAGLIYMINPYIYIRFLAGHFLLLLSYAILPFAVKSMMDLFKEQSRKNIIKTGLFLTLTVFNFQFTLIALGIFFIFFLINIIKNRKDALKMIKTSILVFLIFLLLNFNWISFSLTYRLKSAEAVSIEDVQFFSTKQAIDFNVFFNVAAMYGFWREGYILPKSMVPYWYLFFVFIFFLTVHGFLIKMRDRYVQALVVIAIISLILATGITHQVFSKLFLYLYENITLFRAFREPQKFVALIVLAYSFIGGLGVADFHKQFIEERRERKIIFGILILLTLITPFIYTFTIFNGFYGQLNSKFYPKVYQDVNNYLNQDKTEFNVLYLPWHGYMDYTWSLSQRIATPAVAIFSKPVIQGFDPASHPNYPTYNYITFLLSKSYRTKNFGELVSLINVKYIIIDKTSLAPKEPYNFLYNQTDLELVIDSDLAVFKNMRPTAKIYETDKMISEDWDELLKKNITQKRIPLDYNEISPIEYVLKEKPTKKYVVFTSTYSEDWVYDGEKSMKNLGLTNIFNATDAVRIYYSRFNYNLIGYIISCIAFIGIIMTSSAD